MQRGTQGDWEFNRFGPVPKLFGGYQDYRAALLATAQRAPGTIVVTASHGWSGTRVLAGVRCRLPQATVLVNQQVQASTIDMILLAASLKGQVLRLEKYMRAQSPPDQMRLYHDISGGYARHGGSDFEQI